jgi:hypothetical protein
VCYKISIQRMACLPGGITKQWLSVTTMSDQSLVESAEDAIETVQCIWFSSRYLFFLKQLSQAKMVVQGFASDCCGGVESSEANLYCVA